MIYFGDSKIGEVYWGNSSIKEIYFGNDLVWRKAPVAEYVPLQYVIIPTMSQGDFLTDYDPTVTTGNSYVCEFKIRPDADTIGSNVGAGFCETDGDNFGAAIGQCSWTSKKWTLWGTDWGTTTVNTTASTSTDVVLALAINPSSSNQFAKLSAGGTTTNWGKANFRVNHWGKFHIDGCSKDASIAGEAGISGRIYYLKETLGGELVHDYIPARTPDNSKIGFYDTISGQWVLRSAGAAWGAGPDSNGLLTMATQGQSLTQRLLEEMENEND